MKIRLCICVCVCVRVYTYCVHESLCAHVDCLFAFSHIVSGITTLLGRLVGHILYSFMYDRAICMLLHTTITAKQKLRVGYVDISLQLGALSIQMHIKR